MALKDWKQISSLTWANKKIGKQIHISERFKYNTQKMDYVVLLNSYPSGTRYQLGGSYNGKEFKSRSQAIAYAKSYMRTH